MTKQTQDALMLAGIGIGGWLLVRELNAYSFRGRVVLITGGSRGLGLILARKLTAQGARVILLARDGEELAVAAEDVARFGATPWTAMCDVTNADDVYSVVTDLLLRLGSIDVVINNAGLIQAGPASQFTRKDFEDALNTNFWGTYNTLDAVLPEMRRRKAGRIINISSIGGLVSIPHLLPYSVSKFALVAYSRGLRTELAGNGITVTTVCPGLMRTGSARNATFKGQGEKEYAWFKAMSSIPLLTMSAERAANQILKSASYGEAEVVLSLPAKLLVQFQSLFPSTFFNLVSLANSLLPGPGSSGLQSFQGKDCETAFTRSPSQC